MWLLETVRDSEQSWRRTGGKVSRARRLVAVAALLPHRLVGGQPVARGTSMEFLCPAHSHAPTLRISTSARHVDRGMCLLYIVDVQLVLAQIIGLFRHLPTIIHIKT